MELSDAILLQRWVERRDAEAMAEIVARHSRMVYAACRRILGSDPDAADATQECFIRLASVRRAGPSLPGLLHTTATRLALNHRRAESRRRHYEQRYIQTLDPARDADWDDVQAYIDEAIAGLDEKVRAPIVRHFLEGETHEAIARDLGLTRAAVSYRIDRGIREVRERLRRKGIAVAAPALAGMLALTADAAEALPVELAQSLGRAAIAGVQPRPVSSSLNRMLTGKGALSMKTAAVIAGIVALAGIFTALKSDNHVGRSEPVPTAAVAVQEAAAPEPPAEPPAAPAPAQEPAEEAAKEPLATVGVTVVSDTGYARPDVYFSNKWPLKAYEGKRSDIDGRAQLAVDNPEPVSYMALSQNTHRAALLTVSPASTQLDVVLSCNIIEISGRVVDDAGKPVPIAAVELRITDNEGREHLSYPLLTDMQGYFENENVPAGDGYTIEARVLMPEGEDALGWSPPVSMGQKSYHVEIPDLKIPQAAAEKAAHNKLFFEIENCFRGNLTEAAGVERYSGLVQNPQGQPVAGVFVELMFSRTSWGVETRAAVTDAQGRWSRLLPVGLAQVTPTFKHADYVSTSEDRDCVLPNVESMRDGTAVVTLRPGVRVAGVVRDEAGKPVPDVLIYSRLNGWTAGGPEPTANWPMEDMTSIRTGADGSFALGCIPEGEQKLNVRKLGFAAMEVPILALAGMAPLNIVLETGGTIRGRILNQDGEPVPGAYLYSMDANLSAKVDDQGNFAVEHAPRGKKVSLDFFAKGYYNSTIQDVVARDEPYELILYKPLVFVGRVIDSATGRPVAKFEVSQCWQLDGEERPNSIDTSRVDKISSPNGEFTREFDGVTVQFPDRTLFAVCVVAQGYYPGLSPLVRLADKMQPFTISLQPGESVSGMVVQPDGRPASGAQVICTETGRRLFVQRGQINLSFMLDDTRYQKTGADGAFDLPGSPEPMGLLALHATGYALFTPGQHISGGTVTLTPWATISGTAYRGGAPEAGIDISFLLEGTAHDDPIQWLQERSGPGGKFVFSNVPALPLVVGRGLWTAGRTEISHGVHIHPSPGEHVVVDIGASGCTVEGQLDFDLPENLPDDFDKSCLFRIIASPHEDPVTMYVATVEADGQFQIHDVPPGPYDLTAGLYAPPPEAERGDWTLVADGELAFEIPAAAGINEVLDLGTIALEPKE